MSWDEVNKITSPETKAAAEKSAANKKQAEVDLAQTFARCFNTNDGKKVLEHLSHLFIFNNDTPFSSNNINYESAYHNGESGAIKYIIGQRTRARII